VARVVLSMDDVSSVSRFDRSPSARTSRTWRPERCDRVALQGGGAPGAYQAGVYQAEHG
jgi:NTE family protein